MVGVLLRQGVACVAYAPLGSHTANQNEALEHPVVAEVAARNGRTPAQVGVWRRSVRALGGSGLPSFGGGRVPRLAAPRPKPGWDGAGRRPGLLECECQHCLRL
jgi:hypothetical protein